MTLVFSCQTICQKSDLVPCRQPWVAMNAFLGGGGAREGVVVVWEVELGVEEGGGSAKASLGPVVGVRGAGSSRPA